MSTIMRAVIAGAVLAGALSGVADAKTRLFFGYNPYYAPGPLYMPAPRYGYYYDPPVAYNYDPYDDDDYYVPRRVYRPKVQQPQAKAVQPVAKPKAKPKTAAISCSKATQIVTGFGFSSVKSTDCKGDIYVFSAMRDGNPFSVKLSAKNGELKEVKKL